MPMEEKSNLVFLARAFQYFDVRCKSAVADMLPAETQSFKADSKCVAAGTYAPWPASKFNIYSGHVEV